jgi:hypothetical protein
MKRIIVFIFVFCLLLVHAVAYVDGKISPSYSLSTPREETPVQLAVVSPQDNQAVNGDFFLTGVAADAQEGVKSIDVTFASLYDNKQEPIKQYSAHYNEQEKAWSTHVKNGDLPDGIYDVKVSMHTKEGNTRFSFSSVIVDSSLTSRITTL